MKALPLPVRKSGAGSDPTLPLPSREGVGGGGGAPTSPPDRVPVLLPYPFPGPFDYRVPPDLHPEPGDVVLVPLNRRQEIGVVWDHASDESIPDRKLKPLSGLIDTPPMRLALRQFVDWVASYTLSSPGEVMAMALRIVTPGITPPPPAGNAPPNHRPTPASPKPARKSSPPWPQPNPAPPATSPAPPASPPA